MIVINGTHISITVKHIGGGGCDIHQINQMSRDKESLFVLVVVCCQMFSPKRGTDFTDQCVSM